MPALILTTQEAAAAEHLAHEHGGEVLIRWQPGDEGIVCEAEGRRWAVTLDGGIAEVAKQEAVR